MSKTFCVSDAQMERARRRMIIDFDWIVTGVGLFYSYEDVTAGVEVKGLINTVPLEDGGFLCDIITTSEDSIRRMYNAFIELTVEEICPSSKA